LRQFLQTGNPLNVWFSLVERSFWHPWQIFFKDFIFKQSSQFQTVAGTSANGGFKQ